MLYVIYKIPIGIHESQIRHKQQHRSRRWLNIMNFVTSITWRTKEGEALCNAFKDIIIIV